MKKRNTKGEGSTYKDEKRKRWVSQYRWTDKQGKKHKKTFVAKKKSEAQLKLNEFKKGLNLSNLKSGNNPLFREYAEIWLYNDLIKQLVDSSFARKKQTFDYQVFPIIGDIPMEDITHTDVQNMINQLDKQGYSYSSIVKAKQCVNGTFRKYRVEFHYLIDPCENIILPKKKKKDQADIKYFDKEQRQLIKEGALRKHKTGQSVYRMGCLIVVLMYTGMRVGELLGLKWENVNFDDKTIKVDRTASQITVDENGNIHYNQTIKDRTKTQSAYRFVPMNNETVKALKIAQSVTGNCEYICTTKNGKLMTESNIYRMLQNIQLYMGIAESKQDCLGVHALRHTFASMMFQNNCPVKIVSEILGHADTKVTENTYIHLIDEQKAKAIENIDEFSD